jgi:hypothetical protein
MSLFPAVVPVLQATQSVALAAHLIAIVIRISHSPLWCDRGGHSAPCEWDAMKRLPHSQRRIGEQGVRCGRWRVTRDEPSWRECARVAGLMRAPMLRYAVVT